jgi:hypothetical protein
MRVFVSWSGARSKHVASELRRLLPCLLHRVDPWMSEEDIEKGRAGIATISAALESTNFGIVVLTPENAPSTWINFEAGALAKNVADAYVFTVLVDLRKSQLTGPLAQFQATDLSSESDVLRLIRSINRCDGLPISDAALEATFEKWWPEVDAIQETLPPLPEDRRNTIAPERDSKAILEEILDATRQFQRRLDDLEANRDRPVTTRRPTPLSLRQQQFEEDVIAWALKYRVESPDVIFERPGRATVVFPHDGYEPAALAELQRIAHDRGLNVEGVSGIGPD